MAGLSPENHSFEVVRDTESNFRAAGTALANEKEEILSWRLGLWIREPLALVSPLP